MRNALIILFFILGIQFIPAQEIEWMTWEEAIAKTEKDKDPKKIFIDVYTDWCGWCKRMDKDTFNNPEVAAYMKENFYMVKFDAESKEPITYRDQEFKFVSQGRSGYHELAAALLQGRLSFPTVVFMSEKQEMLSPVPGYQKPKEFLMIARYFGDDLYKTTQWDEYEKNYQ
ncbi:thioredoxin family protein [Robertkochia solimangrovi]|uniref:thioredoxin family protein n=1 Tax=Robertkochia solimangrovi TaxID=2213046 RepID=UPI00117E31F8|nr:DUF255 domain-containing protein [Robertkochia solimangrovi]TRZ42772.1 thioredoxin [Robertkochia solimangrovi]